MAKTSSEQGENRVGPGHPPKEHRFKPGQSGNPKGRPKNPWREEVLRLLAMPSGEARDCYQTAILKRLRQAAMDGDLKAIALLANMVPGAFAPKQTEAAHTGKVTLLDLLTAAEDGEQ